MKIFGLQKTTLLDYPAHVACTVFTGGCNFRCPFCHNAQLIDCDPDAAIMSEDDFFSFLKKRHGILDGVCVTGGEPLLQPDTEQFLKKIKDLGFHVKLDTNGSFPKRLSRIINSGLCDYVAMDIKSSRRHYCDAVGIDDYNTTNVEESVKLLLENKVPYEFRTTAVKGLHVETDFEDIAVWLNGAESYYIQNFVDSDTVPVAGLSGFSKPELEHFEALTAKTVKKTGLRGV